MAPPEHVNGAPESEFELWLSQDFSQLNNFLASKPAPAPHDKLLETEPSASPPSNLDTSCSLNTVANNEYSNIKNMQPRTSDIYNCPLSDSVCEDIEDYICHIKAHADYEGAHTCSIEGCGKSFRKLRTLLRHMHQHHPVTEDPSNRHNLPFEAYCRARLPWFNSSMGLFMTEPVRLWREHLSHDQLRAVCSNCGNHVRLYERLGMCGIFGQWILHAVKCHKYRNPTESDLPPFERYICSSSEDEGAEITEIIEGSLTNKSPPSPEEDNLANYQDYEDDAMSNSAGSSISAVNSYSSTSDTSFIAKRKQALRYKKRREARNPKASRRGIFQCSFCMADFVNTGNLHRHEREVHLTVERFVCEPYSMENVRGKFCPYCGKPFDLVHDPTRGEYVDQYGCGCGEAARLCANKPLEERTFTRKDHFIQHLKCIHGISQWPEGFDAWSKSVSSLPQTSRCGFCGSTFNDWNERKAHIVSHYRSGMKMEQWEGDWGLTPEWERLLQQAIPPRDRADVKLYAKKQPWWKPQSGGVSTWLEQVYPPEL